VDRVFRATQRFVIYEAGGRVRYLLPESYDVARELRRRIANLEGLRASIEDLKAEPSLEPNERLRAATETAWALAIAFEDETEPPSTQPNDILTRVDTRLRSLVKSEYRKQYVFANLAAFCAIEVLLIAGFLIALRSLSGDWSALIGRYALYGMLGALGAFLSVIMRVRTIDVDINLSVWEHAFAGVTRVLIGVIGALVAGLALDSHLIDPTFGSNKSDVPTASQLNGHIGQPLAMYLIISFIAGFSESLVPNILRQGEQVAGGQGSSSDAPIVKTQAAQDSGS
jgi:hypothetical protein